MGMAHKVTCVCAVVCLQMGALGVGLATAHVVTGVRGDPLPWPGAPSTLWLGLLLYPFPRGDQVGLCRGSKVTGHHHLTAPVVRLALF